MPAENIILVDHRELKRFMKEGFIALGVPADDAEICSKVLIESDLRGIESHGIGRFKMYVDRIRDGIQFPVTRETVLKETANTAVIDGGHGMGHVSAYRAMQRAIDMARKSNIGMVSVKNSTHFGITGYYPAMAIENDMVGLAFCNARPSVAPTFGVQPAIGTNPISFGAPSDDWHPFLLDIATSTSQRGKMEVYAREGKPTPKGVTIALDGSQPTDSRQLLEDFVKGTASLLPLGGAGEELGGYKGYGLGVMVEILSAAFSGGMFGKALSGFDESGTKIPYHLGFFFMAINIQSFVPLEVFKQTTGAIMREIRSARKAPGHERIYLAGEKEFELIARRKAEGIPINPALQKIMQTLHTELGLGHFDFAFL